ncbi:MAG: DAK2 domain-containing protein [Clostridia bacterium]|nr:DAK2 domain-containing protein [Clostridia bacterium]
MSIKRINGTDLERMVKMAYLNLQKHEAAINAMNVFPVTDGDTGTNMRLTLLNGIHHATPNTHLGNYLKQLSDGMLLGARGNSGVILSQIFRGFYLALSSDSIADVGELRDAFILGYKTAYQSVTRPVEGTILTVAREGIENIKSQIGRNTYIPNLISMYVAEMRKTLSHTPEMLPVLKEAGVVDSGGYGYILMMEGMEKCLYGEEISADEETWLAPTPTPMVSIGSSAKFNENSNFELGYCMEFLLQLVRCKTAFFVRRVFSGTL